MMPTSTVWTKSWVVAALAMTALSCSKEEEKPKAKPVAPAVQSAPAVAAPAVPPPASSAAAAPSAEPSGAKIECPKGSSGEGSFNNPCEAKGNARMMEVTWTGKTDDKGPSFRVVNKSEFVILHGKIAVYFYDKAGKQLEVPVPSTPGGAGKPKPFHTCSGHIFSGIMKPAEKAVLTFSCVKQSHVPEGTAAIEAEMQTVGIADASEKRVDYYWRNADLTPDERPKGGIKKKK